ncbi:MAG: sulfotransferase [Notoacmeibacter sp.]|nr:sulfotransferase [Notoacmeibacter sp.]
MHHGYTRDLATLGAYWRGYAAIMDHFTHVLGDRILHVDYETLVTEPEPGARAIVAHCGLEWDNACLEFWKTERRVSTLSREQVRQPVYTTSLGRWRRYGPGLQPLLDAIAADA